MLNQDKARRFFISMHKRLLREDSMKQQLVYFSQSPIHYRKNIYLLMDKELAMDFYFGDSRPGKIAPFDVTQLKHFKGTLHNINCGPFYWQRGVLKLLRSDYTDIITPGDTYCLSTWALLFFAKWHKKRVYLWTHGAYGNEHGLKLYLTKKRVKLCAGVFLYGNYAKQLLLKYGADEKKLHVIYNSLDYDNQIGLREKVSKESPYIEHFNNKCKNLIFIGRLTRIKKLDQLIKAVSILKEKRHNVNLTFVGDGEEMARLQGLTKELNLEQQIWFYGACYDELQKSELLYHADLCVSPGNVGLTAMDAMSFGTPVISHNNMLNQMPEVEAIEEGKTGGYFKENDIDSLADSIEKWFNSNYLRDDIRRNCYKVIDEKYNPHKQVELLHNVINKNNGSK